MKVAAFVAKHGDNEVRVIREDIGGLRIYSVEWVWAGRLQPDGALPGWELWCQVGMWADEMRDKLGQTAGQ